MNHSRHRTVSRILLGLGVLTLALGCDQRQPALTEKVPPEVFVTAPIVRPITNYEEFTGRTNAASSVEVRARVTGHLQKVLFKDGADVQAGELLFIIDQALYQATHDKAKASLALAEARLHRVNKDYARITELASRTAVSQGELDLIAGDKAEAEASVGVAQADLRLAQENLNYTEIRAPFAGRISRHLLDVGNLVTADVTILTTIVSLDPIQAYFDVDERTLLRLRRLVRNGSLPMAAEGQARVQIGLADENDYSLNGVVDFVDNQLDPGTGTLRVRAEVANPYHLLSPGLFVRIRFPTSVPRDAILVPEQAIGTDQGQKFVYVVNAENQVVYRSVKLGQLFEDMRAVEEGISPQDRVIVSGIQRVRPGAKVKPKPAEPPATPQANARPNRQAAPIRPADHPPAAGVAGL
ncbi:MAG: efflux RND transporter periplasmic adaptor subunit [Bacteroidales bacterium]|nr:efflux RND transporter periplasmic adaptor subunit [Bacteroidales bacterium]